MSVSLRKEEKEKKKKECLCTETGDEKRQTCISQKKYPKLSYVGAKEKRDFGHPGSISPTFYSKVLRVKIQKAQKIQSSHQFFCAFGTCACKSYTYYVGEIDPLPHDDDIFALDTLLKHPTRGGGWVHAPLLTTLANFTNILAQSSHCFESVVNVLQPTVSPIKLCPTLPIHISKSYNQLFTLYVLCCIPYRTA